MKYLTENTLNRIISEEVEKIISELDSGLTPEQKAHINVIKKLSDLSVRHFELRKQYNELDRDRYGQKRLRVGPKRRRAMDRIVQSINKLNPKIEVALDDLNTFMANAPLPPEDAKVARVIVKNINRLRLTDEQMQNPEIISNAEAIASNISNKSDDLYRLASIEFGPTGGEEEVEATASRVKRTPSIPSA